MGSYNCSTCGSRVEHMGDECPTCLPTKYGELILDNKRLRTRLAAAEARLEEAVEFIKERAANYYKSSSPDSTNGRYYCAECHIEKGFVHLGVCGVGAAQAFLAKHKEKPL